MLRWFGVVLLILAGLEAAPPAQPRIPLAPPAGSGSRPDRVTDRIHALLVGREIRCRALCFVPLHARSPAEARRTGAKLPIWSSDGVRVRSPAAGTLLLRHTHDRPVLIAPGRAWTIRSIHFRSVESALIEPSAPGFLRVGRGASPAQGADAWMDAPATGSLLAEPGRLVKGETFQRGDFEPSALYRQCERATRVLGESGDRTIVGCVALVGGEPVLVYAFGDRPVFAEARRDLVAHAIAAAERTIAQGTPEVLLRQRAERAHARGISVAMLRALCATNRRSEEVPGGGARWRAGSRKDGYIGRALVDGEGRLVFFGAWRVPKVVASAQTTKQPPVTRSDPEEDRRRKKSGRFNPLRNGRAPGLPPLPPGR